MRNNEQLLTFISNDGSVALLLGHETQEVIPHAADYDNSSIKSVGHHLARHSLLRLNRERTGYGMLKYNMNQMGLSPSASSKCGAASQPAHHMVGECPLHNCYEDLIVLDTASCKWLRGLMCDL